jgi:ribose transport system substrate-binding protein
MLSKASVFKSLLVTCVAALLLLIILAVPGCRGAKEQRGGESSKPRIALVMKSLANEFFATMAEGARQHQSAHSEQYELIVNGIKDERDLGRQVALVEEMIAQQVDAIVIAPADSKALIPVLKRAQAAGVIVVDIDNKLDSEVLADAAVEIPFVGPDNRSGARQVGEYLAQQLQAGAQVALLEGIPTSFNSQQRRQGFEEAMTAAEIEIVATQSAQWEMGIANQVASAILSEHPQLDAILACNDSMALGALAAAKAAGRAGDVKIVGFDNISGVQRAIRDGEILATADQHAGELAVFGIEYALQLMQGDSHPADKETPVDLITAESLP